MAGHVMGSMLSVLMGKSAADAEKELEESRQKDDEKEEGLIAKLSRLGENITHKDLDSQIITGYERDGARG